MVSEPYDQDAEEYTWEQYEGYRKRFLEEYTSKDPALIPSTFSQWVAFNVAMDHVG